MHCFDTKQLVVKVEILTDSELWSRSLWTFLVKYNQFYRETRLTCPLYRTTKDICICIYVFKRVFKVWHMLKNGVNATTFWTICGETKRWGEVNWLLNVIINDISVLYNMWGHIDVQAEETKKTKRKVFGYFWSCTTKVWLCKSIFPTRTV